MKVFHAGRRNPLFILLTMLLFGGGLWLTPPLMAQPTSTDDFFDPLFASPPVVPPVVSAPVQTTKSRQGVLQLQARLNEVGAYLKKGLRWRVNKARPNKQGQFELVAKSEKAVDRIRLPFGKYIVTAIYGHAYLSQQIEVTASATLAKPAVADFILHAGALNVVASQTGKGKIAADKVSMKLYLDERDQEGNRLLVLDEVPVGKTIRLNAGIYYLVSRFGPHNASEETNLTIEPGKMTRVTMRHTAGQVLVKLVNRAGGEALPGTRWEMRLPDGQVVGKSVGAVPSFILQAGEYHIIAINQNKTYRRRFELPTGVVAELEIDTSEKGAADGQP